MTRNYPEQKAQGHGPDCMRVASMGEMGEKTADIPFTWRLSAHVVSVNSNCMFQILHSSNFYVCTRVPCVFCMTDS